METGWYYLQSRYYDPVTHRFINADSYASTGQGVIGHNMFAYCNNSPVTFADFDGHMALEFSNQKNQFLTINASAAGSGGGIIIVPITFFSDIANWFGNQTMYASDDDESSPTETVDVRSAGNVASPSPDDDKNNNSNRNNSLPPEGNPNSDLNLYDQNGNLKQTRHYGPDGKAQYDIDYSHGGAKHKFPHKHWWIDGKRQSWFEFEVYE